MFRTLVLFRMRCGCFDGEGWDGEGSEESVLTYKTIFKYILFIARRKRILSKVVLLLKKSVLIFLIFLNCCIKHRKAVCHLSSSQTTEGIFSHCVLGWNYSLSSVAYEINRKLQLDVNIKYFWTSTVGIKALKAKLTSF